MGNKISHNKRNKKQHKKESVAGQVFHVLSIAERLRCERVSPRWSQIMWDFGWTEQKVLNWKTVFDGDIARHNMHRFDNENLISLFRRTGTNLFSLELESFITSIPINVVSIFQHFTSIPNLTKLDIRRIQLKKRLIDHLPFGLCELHLSAPFSHRALLTLSKRCPMLESVVIDDCFISQSESVFVSFLDALFLQFCGLKKVHIQQGDFSGESDEEIQTLTSIGMLSELEELQLLMLQFVDDTAFRAMARNCHKLRRLCFDFSLPVTEKALFELAKLPNLVELEVWRHSEFTDSVLKIIASQGRLKHVSIIGSKVITDYSIEFLLTHCKLLVYLDISHCHELTNKSLEAVLAEINRRQIIEKNSSENDNNTAFHFNCRHTSIDHRKLQKIDIKNRWIIAD